MNRSLLPPRIPRQQDQQREQFQTPGQHIDTENQFRENGIPGEILRRSYRIKAGTDIVDRRCDGREIRSKIKIIQRNKQKRTCKQHQVGDQENIDPAQHRVLYHFPVHLHFLDIVLVQNVVLEQVLLLVAKKLEKSIQ